MKIVVIGSGKVATWFGEVLFKNKQEIIQIYSRNISNAKILADKINSTAIDDLKKINTSADVYILAVKDDAVEKVISDLPPLKGLVINTSGSMDISILKNVSGSFGVMWPVVSVTNPMNNDNEFVMSVEASDDHSLQQVEKISSLFTNQIYKLTTAQRQVLHLSAVFGNNFTNYFITIAQDLLTENNIHPSILQPMLRNMVKQYDKLPAEQLQTGPAKRKDTGTMQRHIHLLQNKPEWQMLYKLISENIREKYSK